MEKDKSNGIASQTTSAKYSNEQLVEMEGIPDTPFTAVKVDNKWFLTMGKYRLTEPLQSLEECEKGAFDTSWFRIMQIIGIMMEEYEVNKQAAKQAVKTSKRNI